MAKIYQVAGLLAASAVIAAGQQLIVLNDGTQMQGRFDGGTADSIRFIDTNGSSHRFNITDVQTINFAPQQQGYNNAPPPDNSAQGYSQNAPPPNPGYAQNAPPPSPGYAQNAPPPPGYAQNAPPPPGYAQNAPPPPPGYNGQQGYAPAPGYEDSDQAPPNGWQRAGAIPGGTEIAVRTIDRIDARHADPHQHYQAEIQRDVLDANGNVVIPRGSQAHLVALDVGNGEIALDLRSVRVNGQRLVVDAQDLTGAHQRDGIGANRRTGEYVGGGAVLGTLLGAIAGGGRGAAIGALAGGAAGAGAQVLTRGEALHIPPETVLRFRVDHPVYLYQ